MTGEIKTDGAIDALINLSGKDFEEVIEMARKVKATTSGGPDIVSVTLALQIIMGGGIEAHAETMLPDSIWVLEILPKLRMA